MRFLAALLRRRRWQTKPSQPEARPPALLAPAPLLALPPPSPKPRYDLRAVSPRRFAEIAHELYLEGSLRWDEYQSVGFPSELHPDYAATIGALTGERAEPDRPRDMLEQWERRIAFMRRCEHMDVTPAERALDVLRRQAGPR